MLLSVKTSRFGAHPSNDTQASATKALLDVRWVSHLHHVLRVSLLFLLFLPSHALLPQVLSVFRTHTLRLSFESPISVLSLKCFFPLEFILVLSLWVSTVSKYPGLAILKGPGWLVGGRWELCLMSALHSQCHFGEHSFSPRCMTYIIFQEL